MALKEYWVGSVGPLLYEDTDTYEDGTLQHGIRTNKILLDEEPVEDNQAVRLQDISGLGGGLFGSVVEKTIAGGTIGVKDTEHFIALTGEGDTTDELTGIYGDPGLVKVGFIVILTGKAGLSYTIKISAAVNFSIGFEFNIDNENDAITLIHRGGGVWMEFGARNNAG